MVKNKREQFLKEFRWMQRQSKLRLFMMLRECAITQLLDEKEDLKKNPERVLKRLKTIQTQTEA